MEIDSGRVAEGLWVMRGGGGIRAGDRGQETIGRDEGFRAGNWGVRHKGRELKARELTGKKTINLQGGAGKYYAWT